MLRILLLLITVLISVSLNAETQQNSLSPTFKSTLQLSTLVPANITEESVTSAALTETQKKPASENQSKSIDFAQPIHFNQLNHKPQQSPEYVLIYELLTEKINVFANRESALAQSPPAWFMQYTKSSSRLSGWKESNSQYASKVTYHTS